jgi:predicted ATPase/DNA-binding SARP family transcriptional activator
MHAASLRDCGRAAVERRSSAVLVRRAPLEDDWRVEFRLLGPLEVVVEGRAVPLDAAKPRALLAILLLRANEPVTRETLIEELWAGRPPPSATKVLQTYVSQLRRVLGRSAILTVSSGYELRPEPGSFDLHRFEQFLASARAASPAVGSGLLREALSLWRGPPLAEFAYDPWARPEIERLEELRLGALQERIEVDLALGAGAELVPELELLVARYPLRERLRAQLMLALYRSGRQADALAVYRDARHALVETLGIEPGLELKRLERAILDQDPELAPAAGRPASLPRWPSSFVGRKRELHQIRALLARPDTRILTLTGPPGTGKTRLAVEAMVAHGELYPDGVVLVELAGIADRGLVTAAIADGLGLYGAPGRRPDESLALYLAGRRMLLLLDNFEQVLDAAPLLSGLSAAAPQLALLVTSRAPLGIPEERQYPVPPLGTRESARLFVDRARVARVDFELTDQNADAVAELCQRLDGLPLALELAAARVKVLAPDAMLERLGRRLDLLQARPGSRLPERHRTMRAAIDWSVELLSDAERELFTSLAVFVGGFTLEAADAVADRSGLDVVDALEALLDSSLLRIERMAGDHPRFGMLESVRDYALELLDARGDADAVRRRHAVFYVPLVEEAEPALFERDQLSWVKRLDAERENLRASMTWAAESGETEVGLRIASALWVYWLWRGHGREGRERLERLLAGGSGSDSVRALAHARIASLALHEGDHEAVRRHLEISLPVFRRAGDDRLVAGYLPVLGTSAIEQGDIDGALALTREGLDVARRCGDPYKEANAYFNLGLALGWSGDLDAAERALEECVRGARRLGNVRSTGNWLRSLGTVWLARGEYEKARPYIEESLAVARSVGDPRSVAHCLTHLALLAMDRNEHEAARELVAESIALARKIGERWGIAANLELCASLATAQNDPARAARLAACASVLRAEAGLDPCELGWPDPELHVARIRSVLGEEAFAAAWAEGRAMRLNDALDNAVARGSVDHPARGIDLLARRA